MTVQAIENFMLSSYTDEVINLYSHKLSKIDERPGFFEDIDTPRSILRPVAIQNKDSIIFDNNETENEKKAIIMMNSIIYQVKSEIESFYQCKELTSFEGGLVKLTEGASNGLHSDMYQLDGSAWDDGTERQDDLAYSALLYMSNYNEDFDGGTIYFPNQNIEIKPTKGLLVYFKGDLEHIHEVREVTRGERYAIVMFFG